MAAAAAEHEEQRGARLKAVADKERAEGERCAALRWTRCAALCSKGQGWGEGCSVASGKQPIG